jgi:hypothetical protein
VKLYSLLVIFCVLCFSSLETIPPTYAQDNTGAGGADNIKAALLRPSGWIAQWRCDPGDTVSDFVFQVLGENVVVKIHNVALNQTCERNVTITSDVVKLDGCNEVGANMTLTFDPNDHEYPFKGKNQNCYLKLRAK